MPENHVLLETIQLTSTTPSVTFDNIPQSGYTDLIIVASARGDRGAFEDSIGVRVGNGTVDSGSNYSYHILYKYDTSITPDVASGQTSINWQSPMTASSATANTFGNSIFTLSNYTSNTVKYFTADSRSENNGAAQLIGMQAARWSGTNPINIVTLFPRIGSNFVAGSTFSLYGVAALGTTPATSPKATGGNIVANDGTYWYHAFLTSGTFTPQTPLTCDVLQIAGGGAGGSGQGGGGGAGGVSYLTSQALTATNYACVVGAGGAGRAQANGSSGTNSQFGSLAAAVGGGGGAAYDIGGANGLSGGSGGGAAAAGGTPPFSGGSPTSGQGNAGGSVTVYAQLYYGGGGGGAGSAGTNGGTTGGTGGAGITTYSSWGLATLTGQNISGTYWFAGGGGGAGEKTTSLASGGNGGGAASSTGTNSGTAATGGGGGATPYDNRTVPGGNGGSGVVIIRYPMA